MAFDFSKQAIDVSEFDVAAKKFMKQVEQDAVIVQKSLAVNLFTRIVQRTPVDTGNARSNWNIATGAPVFDVVERKFDPAAAPAASQGVAMQKAFKLKTPKTGQTIWITNGADYIGFLEFGTSRMAPFAMVQLSVQEITQAISL